jgi:glycosyltransferase involved in cell wall biosynthesis
MTSSAEGKRILFVNHSIPPWENSGTPITTLNHARGMRDRGMQVAILIPSREVHAGFKKEILDGIPVYLVPAFDRYKAFLGNLERKALKLFLTTIAYITRDFAPDFVHINDYVYMPADIVALFHDLGCLVVRNVCNDEEICHQDYPVIASGLAGELCSGPTSSEKCATCYRKNVFDDDQLKVRSEKRDRLAESLEKRMATIRHLYKEKVDATVFTSSAFKTHFTSFVPVDSAKIRIIPRGFKFLKQRGSGRIEKAAGENVRFAFLGTLMFSKGSDVLLRAFERIAAQKNFHLSIHGSLGNMAFQIWLQRLDQLFPGRIVFHGNYKLDQFADLAAQIDIAIVPSYFDTYNRVVRECLYYGVPVIATDFFGAFIIRDGINGLKIPVGDDEALAAAMTRVIDEPNLIRILQSGARTTEIPSLDGEIDALADLYETLLSVRPEKQAKLPAGKKRSRHIFHSTNHSWSRDGDSYLRDIDRLLLSILQNTDKLPISFSSTLFVDTGAGFSSQNAIQQRISLGDDGSFQVTFDLRLFSTILAARFDPWEGLWGRLRLDELFVEDSSGQRRNIPLAGVRPANGEMGIDGFITFKTSDPIVEIPEVTGECTSLTIRGCLQHFDVYWMEAQWENERQIYSRQRDQYRREISIAQLLLEIAKLLRGLHQGEQISMPLVLFGTGALAEWVLQLLDRQRFPVLCCFDNRPRDTTFHGLAVQKPDFIPGVHVIIASMHIAEIRRQLRELGYADGDVLSLRIEESHN